MILELKIKRVESLYSGIVNTPCNISLFGSDNHKVTKEPFEVVMTFLFIVKYTIVVINFRNKDKES